MEHESSAGVSDMRKKIDGSGLSDARGDKNKKNMSPKNQIELKSSESEHKYDLRRSLAWDNAFFTSQGFLEPEELLQCLYLSDKQNSCSTLCQEENKLVASGFLEAEAKNKIDDNTARTSLAWDNAFFTDEGVLDHEELAMVNKGFKRSDARRLQKIEELRKSSESDSTNDSEVSSLALASLKVENFEDHTKASTHKMRETSNMVSSGTKLGRKNDKQTKQYTATKNFAGSLQLKKRLPCSGKQKININRSERNIMDVPLTPPRQVNHIPKAPIKAMYSLTKQVKGENKIVKTTTGDNSSVSMRSDLMNSGNASPLSSEENAKYEYRVLYTSGTSADGSDKSLYSRSKFDSSLAKPGAFFPSVTKSSHVTLSRSSFIGACCLEPPSNSINQSPYKPSGLRMPSPKIGFFDQENKLAPLPTEYEEMKSTAAQNHSSEKLQPQEALSSDSGIGRTPPRNSRQCTVPGAGKDLGYKNKKICPRKERVFPAWGCVELVESVSKPENKLGAMKKNMINENGKHVLQKTRKQSHKERSSSHIFHEHEKENSFGSENHVHGLCVPAEGTNACDAVVIEVEAKNGDQNSDCHINEDIPSLNKLKFLSS